MKENESNLVPYHMIKLFKGGTFDMNYNKKYQPHTFLIPKSTKVVKLVAIITGHGSDNNGCAEFCVTSHQFVFNKEHKVVRIFKNAATSHGCEERVSQGVEPNEHGTWLYGRDGWCPGQEVVPWIQDVTKFVNFDGDNSITYSGLYKGSDPNPKSKPGKISMTSYLVFYKSAADI